MVAAGGEAGLDYWMRWQVPVCALIVVAPAVAAVAVLLGCRAAEPLRAADLWMPCWAWMHPIWLLVYRGVVFFGMSWILSRMVLLRGADAFYFYTQWTFTLVIIFFGIATVISAHGCWVYSKRLILEKEEADGLLKVDINQNSPAILTFGANKNRGAIRLSNHYERGDGKIAGFWGYAMQIIYQTCGGAVILTDVVFWGLLVPLLKSADFNVNVIMGCMHSLNAVFLLLDTALNNLPFPWFGMSYFVFWSCIYVTFQWTLHACGFSWWPYPFLELGTPWAVLWYFAMALVHVPCYGIYYLVVKAKNSLFLKWFPNTYLTSGLVCN